MLDRCDAAIRRRSLSLLRLYFFLAGGAMNFIEKSAIITGE